MFELTEILTVLADPLNNGYAVYFEESILEVNIDQSWNSYHWK